METLVKYLLISYFQRNIGYNIEKQSGHKEHSLETKIKISKSLVGHKVSEETRKKLEKVY